MIFDIDTVYKIALFNFMKNIKNNLKIMLFGSIYKGKLPNKING